MADSDQGYKSYSQLTEDCIEEELGLDDFDGKPQSNGQMRRQPQRTHPLSKKPRRAAQKDKNL